MKNIYLKYNRTERSVRNGRVGGTEKTRKEDNHRFVLSGNALYNVWELDRHWLLDLWIPISALQWAMISAGMWPTFRRSLIPLSNVSKCAHSYWSIKPRCYTIITEIYEYFMIKSTARSTISAKCLQNEGVLKEHRELVFYWLAYPITISIQLREDFTT